MKYLIPILLVLTGCASKSTVLVDRKFASVAVAFPLKDLAVRKRIETRLAKCLSQPGINARSTVELYPPPKDLGAPDFVKSLVNQKMKSLLVLVIGDVDAQHTEIASQAYQGIQIPNYTISDHAVTIRAQLYDLRILQKAWSTIFKGDGDYATSLEANMVSDICTKLLNDGMLGGYY